MRKWQNTENNFWSAAFIIFIILLWELLVQLYSIPGYILPAPSKIMLTLIDSRQVLWEHTKITVFEALSGFMAAVIIGILIAGVMNRFNVIKKILYPILVISQTIPIIAIAPLFMIWLGFGIQPKIVIVILVCFFPIAVSVTQGLAVVDRDLVNLLKVMKANSWQIFFKVELPAVMPAFFSGLKISATYSIMGAVIAEWIGAKKGLGIYMTRAMSSFCTEALFSDILIIVVLSIGLFKFIEWLEKKVMPWTITK